MQIAIAQIRPKKGDYAENLRRIGAVLGQVAGWDDPPKLVVFGETVMSGYFLEGGVREAAVTAGTLYRDLAALHDLAGTPPIDVVVGFYEEHQSRIYNSALWAALGGDAAGVRHVHRKIFLPTYGVFDEERFVDAGHAVQAFDTPFGRAAILICEDVWHSVTATLAALDGADLIVVPSASPARGVRPGVGPVAGAANSTDTWRRLIRRVAEEQGVYVALAQIVGFEGGKGLQGASTLVGPDGNVLVEAPIFDETILAGKLERADLLRARADQPLLSDLETALPVLLKSAGQLEREDLAFGGAKGRTPALRKPKAAQYPVVCPPASDDPLAVDAALLERWLVSFLRDEVVERRGFTKGVVGLSGGVDSAVTAALAARAFGPENVIAVSMPHRTSSPESTGHAALVAKHLGLTLETIDISGPVDAFFAAADGKPSDLRRGNVMARMRMITLFDLSARHSALPLGTGNKSERLLGYFTWHADDTPPVNPLGDLFKTQVWALARHLGIPHEIVDKPATADLIHGQTDEGDLGISYPKADHILYWLVRGYAPDEIVERGFTRAEVEVVKERLDSTHWKRRLATVAMVSDTAIGESYLRPVDY